MTKYSDRDGPDGDNRESALAAILPEGGAVCFTHKNGRVVSPRIHLCNDDSLTDILALQEKVFESVQNKDTFVMTTPQEIEESLDMDFCIGAFLGDVLIAFTLMIAPRPGSRNLGCAGGSPEGVVCVTYDTTFVDPDYSGFGLQRYFITLKDKLAAGLGAREAYATVSPLNAASLGNMRRSGFQIVDEKTMYGGYVRYILRKPLAASQARESAPPDGTEDKEVLLEERDLS